MTCSLFINDNIKIKNQIILWLRKNTWQLYDCKEVSRKSINDLAFEIMEHDLKISSENRKQWVDVFSNLLHHTQHYSYVDTMESRIHGLVRISMQKIENPT